MHLELVNVKRSFRGVGIHAASKKGFNDTGHDKLVYKWSDLYLIQRSLQGSSTIALIHTSFKLATTCVSMTYVFKSRVLMMAHLFYYNCMLISPNHLH